VVPPELSYRTDQMQNQRLIKLGYNVVSAEFLLSASHSAQSETTFSSKQRLSPQIMNSQILLYWQGDGDATGTVCCGGIVIFLVVTIVLAIKYGNEQTKRQNEIRDAAIKRLNQARDAYFDSLRKLKANPTSADLRQTTLQLGRTYSNLTRNQQGVTIYDEVALSNDINAACAGAATLVNTQQPQLQTIESRLQKLAELKSKGLIDEQEYAARRTKILDEV
jgi:hypothetical protein